MISDPSSSQFDEITRLRLDAWRNQAKLKPGISRSSDAWDEKSHHRVLVDEEGRIVGALRFSLHNEPSDLPDGGVWLTEHHQWPGPHAYVSRLILAAEFHGSGLSERLDEMAISEPLRMGARSVTALTGSIEASMKRIRRMKRRGWRVVGVAAEQSPDTFWIADRLPTILMISKATT